jgi:hypothetical protein
MAGYLSGYVDNCVISFIDLYQKTKRNFPQARNVSRGEQEILAKAFVNIGRQYGIQIRTCCEGTGLARFGVDVGGCMTKQILERAIGIGLDIPSGGKSPREACQCVLGHDIGVYNTCSHGCVYCYANYNTATVKQNVCDHDPESPFLIGKQREGDKISHAKQKSYIDGQLSFL